MHIHKPADMRTGAVMSSWWLQAQEAACRVSESEVENAPEPGTRVITFLTKQELRAVEVPELPLAEVALVRPATPLEALPALQPPSKVANWPCNGCLRLCTHMHCPRCFSRCSYLVCALPSVQLSV